MMISHRPSSSRGVGSDHDSSTQGCGSATGVQVYSETKKQDQNLTRAKI